MDEIIALIKKIHATPQSRGGRGRAPGVRRGLAVGRAGSFQHLLETLVPYGRLSMIDFLGHEPEQYVSQMTARDMSRAAYRRAMELREDIRRRWVWPAPPPWLPPAQAGRPSLLHRRLG